MAELSKRSQVIRQISTVLWRVRRYAVLISNNARRSYWSYARRKKRFEHLQDKVQPTRSEPYWAGSKQKKF